MKLLMVSLNWRYGRRTVFVRLQSDVPRLTMSEWQRIVDFMHADRPWLLSRLGGATFSY